MAEIRELNQKAWQEWVSTRPECIQKLCKSHPSNKLYRLADSGHRVTLYSYSEDGTLTVNVSGDYNLVAFDRQVFGIKPEDLIECDLPEEGEILGTALIEEDDMMDFIKHIKVEKL